MRGPVVPPRGSDRLPSLEHASVRDVMHTGVLSCPPEADLGTVARIMVTHHVHSVVVEGIEKIPGRGRHLAWGVLSDLDLVAAARSGFLDDRAGAHAATEVVTIGQDESLAQAAELMTAHQLAHLVVIDATGLPVGVLSTLDVAGAVAWGEA
jgi:crotonyl-CoA carboxylase/reductase